MLSKVHGSIPIIFLVTDGAVEDERHICDAMKNCLTDGRPICPRIYTFGIGNGFGPRIKCLKTACSSDDLKHICYLCTCIYGIHDFLVKCTFFS